MNYFIDMIDKRIEKKFVFGKYKEDYLEKILLNNGFTNLYPSRYINSIYLDTLILILQETI